MLHRCLCIFFTLWGSWCAWQPGAEFLEARATAAALLSGPTAIFNLDEASGGGKSPRPAAPTVLEAVAGGGDAAALAMSALGAATWVLRRALVGDDILEVSLWVAL